MFDFISSLLKTIVFKFLIKKKHTHSTFQVFAKGFYILKKYLENLKKKKSE